MPAYVYHQGQVTVPRLDGELNDLGLDISKLQVMHLLIEGQDGVVGEASGVWRAGIETTAWIHGGRHWRPPRRPRTACPPVIGNERFAWFATTSSKSRLNFLELLRAGHGDYVINAAALDDTGGCNLSGAVIGLLTGHETKRFADEALWRTHL